MPYATAADGVRLYYEAAGAGRPVLLVTGAFSTLADWHDAAIFEDLARERRVIAMDLRGHGGSDRPRDAASYGWRKNAADAFAVLEAEGASGADVYGFSMGGQVAVAMLHADTSRLRSVAAMGVYVPPPGFEPPAAQLVERARLLREEGLTASTLKDLLLGVDDPEPGPWLDRALAGDRDAYIAEAEGQAAMEDQQMPPGGPPTLLIAGERDPLAVALCKDLPAGCAYVRYRELAGARHLAGIEPAILDVLRAFWGTLGD